MPHSSTEKVLESSFPLATVSRLVQAELRHHRFRHPVSRWWYPRPASLWRSVLLTALIDLPAWQALEDSSPRATETPGQGPGPQADAPGHPPEGAGGPGLQTDAPGQGPGDAWQRLFYRLDDEAEQTIRDQVHGRQVLDLFAGGGVVVPETMRLGADVVGIDANPVAWFTLKKSTDAVPAATLQNVLAQLEAAVRPEIEAAYATTCPQCNGRALARHTFWIRHVTCPDEECGASIPLLYSLALLVPADRDSDVLLLCPSCGDVYRARHDVLSRGATFPSCTAPHTGQRVAGGNVDGAMVTCPSCSSRHDWRRLLGQQGRTYRMAALEVVCPVCGQTTFKRPDDRDEATYERTCRMWHEKPRPLPVPDVAIPSEILERVGNGLAEFAFRDWIDLFNPRQLWLLARLRETILALPDGDAAEHLLLAWMDTIETYNRAATYLPGSRWTHTIYSPRPYVPWSLTIESSLWGQADAADTFRGQVDLVIGDVARAWEPADLRLTSGGHRRLRPAGDGFVPSRGRRLLLRQPAHSLAGADLAPGSIDLAIVDPPRVDSLTVAHLSDFLYVWLRTALAREYPVVFAGAETRKQPFTGQGSALTEALRQLKPSLTTDGLVVWVLRRRPDQPWGDSLSPLTDAGYALRAMHPVCLDGANGALVDRSRCDELVLVVAGKQRQVGGMVEWLALVPEMTAEMNACLAKWWPQVEAGDLSSAVAATEALGAGLRCLCNSLGTGGVSHITWHGRPVSLAQALDGDGEMGLVGLHQMVDLLVFDREAGLWPAGLDDASRFYLTTLLGQTALPERRLGWRLEKTPALSADGLQLRQLVRRQGDRVAVKTAVQRGRYLRRRWRLEQAGITQPGLPGLTSGGAVLTTVDRLHLLLGVMQGGEEIGPWTDGWSGMEALTELAETIAQRLPHDARRRRYAGLAAALRRAE